MNGLVSVLIPNYNYAQYIEKAVESVERQTYRNFEIIVVNNGSTDNSLEVLRALGNRITLVDQKNLGQSGSRNSGLKHARGEFIAFLDADDTWEPTKLEKQVALFRDQEVGLVYTGLKRVNSQGETISVQLPLHRGRILENFIKSPGAAVVGGESTAVIRKIALDQAGEFDPRLSVGSGWDMWRRIAAQWKIESVNEPLANYLQHNSNLSKNMKIYEFDTLLKLEKLFSDSASTSYSQWRSYSYATHLYALAGAFHQNRSYLKAIEYCLRSLAYHPLQFFNLFLCRGKLSL